MKSKPLYILPLVCVLILGACSSDDSTEPEEGGIVAGGEEAPVVDSEYLASLKQAMVDSAEADGPIVNSAGLDQRCLAEGLIDQIGEDDLKAEGATPDNIVTSPIWESLSEDFVRELTFGSCLDEAIALENLIEQSGGEVYRTTVECMASEAGSIGDVLSQASVDPAAFSENFLNGPCSDLVEE